MKNNGTCVAPGCGTALTPSYAVHPAGPMHIGCYSEVRKAEAKADRKKKNKANKKARKAGNAR